MRAQRRIWVSRLGIRLPLCCSHAPMAVSPLGMVSQNLGVQALLLDGQWYGMVGCSRHATLIRVAIYSLEVTEQAQNGIVDQARNAQIVDYPWTGMDISPVAPELSAKRSLRCTSTNACTVRHQVPAHVPHDKLRLRHRCRQKCARNRALKWFYTSGSCRCYPRKFGSSVALASEMCSKTCSCSGSSRRFESQSSMAVGLCAKPDSSNQLFAPVAAGLQGASAPL